MPALNDSDTASGRLWPASYPAQCLSLGLLYFALAALGIYLTRQQPDHIAIVWWPNALMLAVLLRTPTKRWPGFIAAAIAANISVNLIAGYDPLLSPGFAACDALEIGLSLALLRWRQGIAQTRRNVRDFGLLLASILGISAPVAAGCGALMLHRITGAPFIDTWRSWWMAECVGMISLLPVGLSLSRRRLSQLFSEHGRPFFAIQLVSLGVTFIALQHLPYPFIVIVVPLLLAALRLGFLGTALLGVTNVLLMLWLVIELHLLPVTAAIAHTQGHLLMATALALLGPLMAALLLEQRDSAMRQLRHSQRMFSDALEYAPIGLLLVDAKGHCFHGNPAASRILGYTQSELADLQALALVSAESSPRITAMAATVMRGEQDNITYEHQYIRKDGSHVWVHISIAAARGDNNEFLHFITQIEDIEERKHSELQREALQRELEHRARHDGLTGLINRQAFELEIDELLNADDTTRQHCVCYIDLDRFKMLNDSAGHAAGDLLLRQIAQRLGRQVRTHDVLARFGGDEFGLLLPDCPAEAAQRIAEGLIDTINTTHFIWDQRVFDIGASIGVVPFTAGTQTSGELMSRADVACYTAKNEGRNRVAVYTDGDSGAARDHHQIQIAAGIREALEAGRFCLYAQQIVPLDEEFQHQRPIELLVRLRTAQGQLLAPGAFIPAAERYDLMADIDRWVVSSALLEYGARLAQIDNLTVSINLSGTSFNDPDFADFLRSLIRNTPLDARRICFELTETAVINDFGHAAELLHVLREEGCLVALDDFGNGLSSFNYLKNFQAQIVKIDGGFVRGIGNSRIDRAIVESINQIAHRIGARTVAEYVETREIADQLRAMGVNYAQGYAFSVPRPLEEVLASMRETTRRADPGQPVVRPSVVE